MNDVVVRNSPLMRTYVAIMCTLSIVFLMLTACTDPGILRSSGMVSDLLLTNLFVSILPVQNLARCECIQIYAGTVLI